ncbi:MAG: hypothetical protein ACRDDH_20320 [Cetobacterium sp.]|uniref:hypothetical protein n=1 Tax=Cetobacterium sp. TaxID=2071632 RepID=UPI003EE5694E
MKKCKEILGLGEFSETSYTDSCNREQSEIMLTKYGFMENVDFVGCKVFNTLARQEVQEYILSIEMGNCEL